VTTVAVNLATRLRQLTGTDVALVDLDLQRGDVAAFLNLTPMQSIAAIAGARGEVDDIFLHSTLTRHSSGIFVMPAPPNIEEADAVSHDDVKLALRLMRGQFRYIVIDTPRTITAASLAALEDADRLLVLTDLSVPGVRAARRTCELLKRLGTTSERVELVVSEVMPGPIELKEATRTIGKQPLLVLPRDEDAASSAMNSGVPLNGTRQAGLSFALGELASKVAGVTPGAKPQRGMFRRIFTRETRT
jgi:pilus assembly protein CpaE